MTINLLDNFIEIDDSEQTSPAKKEWKVQSSNQKIKEAKVNIFFFFFSQKMLCFSPNDRITASEALLHPYFSECGYEPMSFSPTSSSSRSMRSSDASSSFNSSALSFSSHDDSGASLGDMSGNSGPTA